MCKKCTAAGIAALEQLANGQEPEGLSSGFAAETVQIEQTADGSMVRMTMSKPAFVALTLALSGSPGIFSLLAEMDDDSDNDA